MNRRLRRLAWPLAILLHARLAEAQDEPPPPPPPPPPEDVAPAQNRGEDPATTMRNAFRAAGGFEYAQVDGVPITAGRLRLGAGRQNDFVGHYGTLSALYGTTQNGLRTWDLRAGFEGDLVRIGVLRLGLDAELGYLVVRRASVDGHLWALGAGAGAHASLDVIPFGPRDDHAIMLEARCEAFLHFGGAFMWGPSILVGLRY